MIDTIVENLKDKIPGDLLEKFGLDKSKSKEIAEIAGESSKEVMSNQLLKGGLDTVMNLFSSKDNSSSANSLQSDLISNFVGKLTSKLGIDSEKAMGIASSIIPKIIGLISNKNEETDEKDTSSIMKIFGGGDSSIADKAKNIIGGFFK